MFSYYLKLALRNLRRNVWVTVLMILAISAGIGASMTTLALYRAMSGDPIPNKSHQLFVVQVDNWGPDNRAGEQNEDHLKEYLSYIDASALMKARAAKHQTLIYTTYLKARSTPDTKPVGAAVPAVYSDFFAMLDAPFQYGRAWSNADDEVGAPVIVLSRKLNDKLFAGANSVGKTLDIAGVPYRVVGVLNDWVLVPRFYDLHVAPFGNVDEMFIPFNTAIEAQAPTISGTSCKDPRQPGWEALLKSECVWVQLWAEVPASDIAAFRLFINNYATDQQRAGRFHWPAHTQVRDVMQWLKYRRAVPGQLGILLLASFGFLFVCLMNAMGLMLAKTIGHTQDISVRRALGASRRAIAMQSLIETGVVGVVGAGIGLLITFLGVSAIRIVLADQYAALAYLDARVVAIEVICAMAATVAAGLYPTWRAAWTEPALQLKVE
jgi:putative ABC transport system permease protein